jgi:starch phosphorylase
MAKLLIRLTHDIGRIIDSDSSVAERLKLLFIPNYDVTTACDIIPAAELSQQISTAGMEASGTGNMKLALNGALTIGTMDGANVEIRERVGPENIFTFGLQAHEVEALRQRGYRPRDRYEQDPELRRALDMIGNGYFSPEEPERYRPVIDSLLGTGGDRFMVLEDFRAYLDCYATVDHGYRDPPRWTRRAVLNTAMMGHFASDRTVRDYAEKVWGVSPVRAG